MRRTAQSRPGHEGQNGVAKAKESSRQAQAQGRAGHGPGPCAGPENDPF